MTAEQVMRVANQRHRAGHAAEARRICRDLLTRQPNHPDALHLLGILEAQAGRLAAAENLIGQAVRARPDFPGTWVNLGRVLVNRQKIDQAVAAYRRAAQLAPSDPAPLHALGLLLSGRGEIDEAIEALSRAIELKVNDPQAPLELGKLLRSKGRLEDAVAAFSASIALNPSFAQAYNSLGNVLRDKGLLDEAISRYRTAIRLKGDDYVTHRNLGNALCEKEQFAEAISAYELALRLKPDCTEAWSQLAFALASADRLDEARAAHDRALALSPKDARVHEAIGATLLLKHDMNGAESSFREAMALGGPSAELWNGLGTALKCLGRFDQASACFREALAMEPQSAVFYKGLISTGHLDAGSAEVERLTLLLNRPDLPVDDRVVAGFVLGQLLDEADQFDQAFTQFAAANSLFKQQRAALGERFDPDALRGFVDQSIATFTQRFIAERQWGDDSELPVFVVGMPRSGTTLIEQIAASHPAVFGAGELADVERLSSGMRSRAHMPPDNLDADSVSRASQAYLDRLRSLSAGASRVIDKMPGNVFHLGLIATLFPGSRVILCRRDPRDNCLSCYFQQFARNHLLYTYDLADCARQYLETERIAGHWLKILPLRLLEVRYEELVADQETQSRRLIDFLGLPWDPACLEFHKTQRTVTTASVWQVRQPMYSRSVGRWRNYERHLGPLFDVLDGKTPEAPAHHSAKSCRS